MDWIRTFGKHDKHKLGHALFGGSACLYTFQRQISQVDLTKVLKRERVYISPVLSVR